MNIRKQPCRGVLHTPEYTHLSMRMFSGRMRYAPTTNLGKCGHSFLEGVNFFFHSQTGGSGLSLPLHSFAGKPRASQVPAHKAFAFRAVHRSGIQPQLSLADQFLF